MHTDYRMNKTLDLLWTEASSGLVNDAGAKLSILSTSGAFIIWRPRTSKTGET
jgi:hypothetical protein